MELDQGVLDHHACPHREHGPRCHRNGLHVLRQAQNTVLCQRGILGQFRQKLPDMCEPDSHGSSSTVSHGSSSTVSHGSSSTVVSAMSLLSSCQSSIATWH